MSRSLAVSLALCAPAKLRASGSRALNVSLFCPYLCGCVLSAPRGLALYLPATGS